MPLSKTRLASVLFFALAAITLTGCGSPEEKETRYLKRGNEFFDQGDYEKARVEYKNAARLMPTASEPRYRLGMVEEAEGNIKSAFADFVLAEQQDPHFHPVLIKLADYYIVSNQTDKAQQRIDVILSDTPDDPEAHALHAALLMRQKDYAGSEKEARFALSKNPTDTTAYIVLVGLYIAQDQRDKAEATIEDGVAHSPKDLSLLLLKAKIYDQSHNLPKIAETFKTIFEIKPGERRYRIALAEIYIKAGKLDDAEATLRAGVAAMPDDDEMEHQLVAFLSEQRSLEAAESEIRSFVAANPSHDKFLLWLSDLYLNHKDVDRAVALLNQIIDKHQFDPEGLAARTALAHIDYLKGDKQTAENITATVLEKDPNDQQALLTRAYIEFDKGAYENTISDLRSILRVQPKTQEALWLLAETLLRQGHLDLAIDTMNQLIEVDGKYYAARVRLAQFYELNGDPKRAMDILFLVTKEEPKYAPAWEITARIAIATKDWATADAAIETLGNLEGQHLIATYLRGQYLATNDKAADAVPKLTEVISANPVSSLGEQALIALVETDRGLGHMQEAAQYIESLKSNSPIVNTILGEVYLNLGKIDQASAAFDAAIATSPTRQEPYIDRAKIFLHDHKTDQAVDLLKKAAAAAPADTRAPLIEAEVLSEAGQYEVAIALYEDLLARNPDSQVVANNLAETIADYEYNDTSALEKARQVAEKFTGTSNPLLLDTLAWVYFRQGNIHQAQTVMERAVDAGAKLPPQAHYHYGAILAKAGDTQKAKAELQQAVADNASYPGIEDAKKLLAGL